MDNPKNILLKGTIYHLGPTYNTKPPTLTTEQLLVNLICFYDYIQIKKKRDANLSLRIWI